MDDEYYFKVGLICMKSHNPSEFKLSLVKLFNRKIFISLMLNLIMEINHNTQKQRFTLGLEDKEAVLSYKLEEKVMNILSVVVLLEFRGKGLAEEITLYAFNYAKDNNYGVIPTCPYVRNKFLREHPEFNPMVLR